MSHDPRYAINEIFYSPQGEGVRVGTMNLFLRFAGCNMACDVTAGPRSPGGWVCDTEFRSHRWLTISQILDELRGHSSTCRAIVLTGGEPSLQLDDPLVASLKTAGYYLAIETNGTRNIDALGLDWITVSPKVAEHALKQRIASELKYVRCVGQGIPRPLGTATHYLISPAFEPDGTVRPDTVRWCVQLCKDYPQWRLSLQTHKFLHVR